MADLPRDHQPVSWAHRLICVLGLILILFSVYGVIGARQVGAELHTLETAVDRAIPFNYAWILGYGALYSVVLSPLTVITDRRVLERAAIGLCLIVFSGVPFWLLHPVTVPRPELVAHDVLSWGVVFVRWLDPPTNCFPSMHVAEAALASLVVWRHDRAGGAALVTVTALIWYASVAIRQHWFVDGLVGVSIAVVVDQLIYRGLPDELFARGDRRWYLVWIGCYGLFFALFASPWWFGWLEPAELTGRWQL